MCSRFEFATKNKESSESFLFLWCLFDLQDLSFWDVKETEDEKVWCFQWLQQSQSPFSIWIASPSSQISLYITFSGYVTPSFLFTCHIIRFTHRVQYLTNSFWPLYQETSSFYFDEKFDQIVHNHWNLFSGGYRLQKLKASHTPQSIFKLSKYCQAAFCCQKRQHSNKLIEFLSMQKWH